MCFFEELRRCLSEVDDLRLRRGALRGVGDGAEVYGTLVREMVKHVFAPNRLRAVLRRAEHEVDPLVDPRRDRLGLERLAHYSHELVRGPLRPGWKLDVTHRDAVLSRPEMERVCVFQKLGEAVKLGDELLDVRGGGEARAPRLGDGREETIGVVEKSPLQLSTERGERLETKQVEEDDARGGVVRTVMKRRRERVRVLRQESVSLLELLQPLRVERPHGLR